MALSEYNQQALATAYSSGWLTDEQYHAAVAGLEAMPHLQAPAFLQEQAIISEGQAEGLRQALAEFAAAQAAAAAATPAPPPAADGLAASQRAHRRRAAASRPARSTIPRPSRRLASAAVDRDEATRRPHHRRTAAHRL